MDINIDITCITLQPERLLLRTREEGGINDFYNYASVPGVGETAERTHHESVDVSRQIPKSFIDEKALCRSA